MRELPWGKAIAVAVVLALVAGIAAVVRGGTTVPDSVQPIAWNHQPCAHCQMLIGDPRHAAQLVTDEGDILSFDDPGCALRYLDAHHVAVHRLWFHHAVEDRWLPADHVVFRRGAVTPMGSGLEARDAGEPDTIDLATATQAALQEPMR